MPGWDVVVCAVVEDLFGEFRLFEGYEVFDELDCGNTVSLTTIIQLRFAACTRQVSRQPFLIKVLRSSGDRWRMLWWDSVEVQGFQDALCQELCWYHRQVTACTRFCTLSLHSVLQLPLWLLPFSIRTELPSADNLATITMWSLDAHSHQYAA